MFIAKNNDLIILVKETREELEQTLQFMVYTSIEETEIEYELYNGEYLTKDDIAKKERERLDSLTLTRGDVFAGLIQARMIDEAALKTIVDQMPEETQEQKVTKMLSQNALANALNFHRNHPMVISIGEQLGVSVENLDRFFETNDYTYLLPEPEPEYIGEGEDTETE